MTSSLRYSIAEEGAYNMKILADANFSSEDKRSPSLWA